MVSNPVQDEPAGEDPQLKLTVCICTYNGAARLPAVLECLSRQTLCRISWEILVIDNASKDDTARVAAELLASYQFPGRVLFEAEPGVTFARRRAALSARSEIICFLDDDNLPNPDYLETALRIFAEHPHTGNVGGRIEADWEMPPTPLVLSVASFALAIVDKGDQPRIYSWITEGPVGAGMCIRRSLILEAFTDPGTCRAIPSRVGNKLISGEDDALAVKVFQAGFERRYDPALHLFHRMEARRMSRDYLQRLYDGIGRGQVAVRQLWAPGGERRWIVLLVGLKDWVYWLLGAIRGPGNKPWLRHIPESVRAESPELSGDLHVLEQSLVWGRVSAALQYAFSRR